MKIKHLAKVGVALLAAFALAACGSPVEPPATTGAPPPAGGDQITLNALFMDQAGYSEQQVQQMIADYTATHPNIKVDAKFVAYEALHDGIVTSASAGTYDIVLLDVIWPAEFAATNIVLDVTDRYPASWKDDMLGGAYYTAEYMGKFYGVPWGPSTKFFYYNTEMVAAVGGTEADMETWDGVLAIAKKIKDAGLAEFPIAWSWIQEEAVICDYGQLLGAFGGQFTDASGKLSVNNEVGVKTLEWMRKTITDGLSNPASTTFLEDDVQKALAQGQTAFGLNWESTFEDLQDPGQSNVVGKIKMIATPKGPSGARPGVNGAMALSIPTKSAHVEEAWDLIVHLTSQEQQDKYPTGWLPNWKSSYTNAAITSQAPEVFAAAEIGYADLILRPAVPNYTEASTALQAEIQSVLIGAKDAQKAMDDAVAAAG